MDERLNFERNLLALASRNPGLCKKLSTAQTTTEKYRFLDSRKGELIPAAVDNSGAARPLHSLVDPEKEAIRLLDTISTDNFLILYGLGGGFLAKAALDSNKVQGLLLIDYDLDGIAELFAARDYVRILGDPRTILLIDPTEEELETAILEAYRPALSGGIAAIPLRPRVELMPKEFASAANIVNTSIDSISDDYSVQAYFGKRWFANTIRNVIGAEGATVPMAPVKNVAISAAGPSLDHQLDLIHKKRKDFFLLATDTSLPSLLEADIMPDAVISIDCQHISYYHFMRGLPADIPLFTDLASPPIVVSRTPKPRFFTGGHPLTVFVSRSWRSFPHIDTSGGNVTYAAVALADLMGAENIYLYGADFSYPKGEPYARGSYIHPYFQRRQTRILPLESLFAAFVFRNESLHLERDTNSWRYETKPLSGYRQKLERLSQNLGARIIVSPGRGACIHVPGTVKQQQRPLAILSAGKPRTSARDFLRSYATSIEALPRFSGSVSSFISRLSEDEQDILTTMLPAAAAIRKRENAFSPDEVLESVRSYCLYELEKNLKAPRI